MKKLLFFLLALSLTFYSCRKKDPPVNVVRSGDLKKGESFLHRQNDSAFYYFNKVVTTVKDSLQIAMAYNYMGVIQSGAGDYFGSQESLLSSLKFLNEQNKAHRSCLASDYNELGLTSTRLKDYDAAVRYFDAALNFLDQAAFRPVILNNKALAYQKKETYNEALKIYTSILRGIKKEGIEYARILSNLAKTKWLQNPRYNAAPELLTALHIRIKKEDLAGQIASYFHLADYYTSIKPDSALYYSLKMDKASRQFGNPDDRIRALQKLITLSPPQQAKQYFESYQKLRDSVESVRNAAKNQFALIRYEVQKNKSDNLKLQRDNTEKKYQIIRQNIILYTILVVVGAGIVIAGFWYQKRKQLLQMEAQKAIRENQLRTSQKVHDVVANGLYRIMTEVQYRETLNKDQLLDKIDILYEQSRDISYERPRISNLEFHEKIHDLLTSFATEDIRVLVAGNNEQMWKGVEQHQKHEIEHVLQELMINMSKHSRATTVAVRFMHHEGGISIYYTDNGTGLPQEFKYGNGLTNTGNRIKELNGSISFEANTGKGLKIQISIPIA